MIVLVTGAAGFIGFNISKFLLDNNFKVIAIDNINDYYPKKFKLSRLKILLKYKNFQFHKFDISNKKKFKILFDTKIKIIIHLAAQVGVRNSAKLKKNYINSNIIGFDNILSLASKMKIKKIIYASSSSVYGNDKKTPTKEIDYKGKPVSFYGLTKSINELQAENFFQNNPSINIFGIRFFTVYGEFPRPDMAIFKLFYSIYRNKTFPLLNYGKNKRDFTYIKNIQNCIFQLMKKKTKKFSHEIFNLGSTDNILINDLIKLIQLSTGKKIKIVNKGYNKEDINETLSDNSKINNYLKINEAIKIKEGINILNKWILSNLDYLDLGD